MKFLNRCLLLVFFALSVSDCSLFYNKRVVEWQDLKFPKQSVSALFLDGNDLYAAAGHDGLWVKDLSNHDSKWQYLGHRVIEGERHFESGVQAVDVYQGRITIGYAAPSLQNNGQRIGMWYSEDRGTNWIPADAGIRDTLSQWSSARSIIRSPFDKKMMLAGYGDVFKKNDSIGVWERIYPKSGGRRGSLHFGLKWHLLRTNEVWAYGESFRFSPLLMRSLDSGATWDEFFRINVPLDNAFYSMAFDAKNPDIIYIGTQGAVIRSMNGGSEWLDEDPVPPLFTDSRGNFFYALQTHPRIPGILFAGAAGRLYGSRNHGDTATIVDTPKELTFILDMWYDQSSESLFIAGDGGVFRLHRPVNAIRK